MFVEIYVIGCIPKLFLVRAIMKVVENTVAGVFCTCCSMAKAIEAKRRRTR